MYSSEGLFDIDALFNLLGIPSGSTVMDFGCGKGYYCKLLAEVVGKKGRVIAVDSNEESIQYINSIKEEFMLDNIEPCLSDIEDLYSIPSESIDYGLMINLFHGLFASNNVVQVFEEIKRVLKLNGRIAIVDFRTDAPESLPEKEIRCSLKKIRELLVPLNFKVKEHAYLNQSYQLIILKKK